MAGDFSIGSDKWPGVSKLIEEAGEVQQVCGKLMGAAGDVQHWDGTDLRYRLTEEIADLSAALRFVAEQGGLDIEKIRHRARYKYELFRQWHKEQGGTLADRSEQE